MPAARPSQASVTNAVAAAVAAGLTPLEMNFRPDGSFQIIFLQAGATAPGLQRNDEKPPSEDEPPTWDNIQCA
jgi:hypothetical protein